MNEISLNGKKICLKVSIFLKLILWQKCWLPIMPIWLSRTIPMSKYFSGSRPLRHNEVQLYKHNVVKKPTNVTKQFCNVTKPHNEQTLIYLKVVYFFWLQLTSNYIFCSTKCQQCALSLNYKPFLEQTTQNQRKKPHWH